MDARERPEELLFSAATYNVHLWIGAGGQRDMDRCLSVVREMDVDLVGLQEASFFHESADRALASLEDKAGMRAVLGPTLIRKEAGFGNVLLSRHPVKKVRRHDISVPWREPRSLIDAEVDLHGHALRVLVTHFGLRGWERRRQAVKLLEIIDAYKGPPALILGDFNEWFRLARSLGTLRAALGTTIAPRSFPALFPLFALDRIWAPPPLAILEIEAWRSRLSRIASDHLPVRVRISG